MWDVQISITTHLGALYYYAQISLMWACSAVNPTGVN